MTARRDGFVTSLSFAAFAGLLTLPVWMAAEGPPGRASLSIGCLALGAAYLFAVAPKRSRGLRVGLGALALGGVVAFVAPGPTALVLGVVFVTGVLRSAFLYRTRPVRALVIETVLLSAGLTLAGALYAGDSALHAGLAVWGFFLVQSLYGVIGGVELGGVEPDGVDPFVKARDSALRAMEESY